MARSIRPCLACGQHDDGARDQVALADGSSVYFHLDCHAQTGCEECQAVLDDPAELALRADAVRAEGGHLGPVFTTTNKEN